MDTKKIQMIIILVIALLMWGVFNRYTIVPVGFGSTGTHHPIAYKLDHWSGKMWLVRGLDAYSVKNSPLAGPTDGEKSW